jgi:cytosine/adenosine deaminase-related metal-dependent hydrolase
MHARVYFEFLGVTEERARERFTAATRSVARLQSHAGAETVLPGLSPHAPYSVWPDLWARTAETARRHGLRWTTHLAEPPEERRFLLEGTGPIRDYLESLGVWDGSFPVPGRGAVALLEAAKALDERALLVHGVHLETEEMDRLAATRASLCLCPRSNAFLGLPPPPVTALLERGVRLCLGTDSKASNRDLGVWGEMRALRRLAPSVPAARILEMATVRGAMALGMSHLCGSLRPGIPANLVAVNLAGALPGADPETCLVEEPVEDRVRVLE